MVDYSITSLKKKIDESFSSPNKRLVADMILVCIERIDVILQRIEKLEATLKDSYSTEFKVAQKIPFLKEFKEEEKENKDVNIKPS